MKNKRYWIFGWDDYYPDSALGQLMATADTLEEIDEIVVGAKNKFFILGNEYGVEHVAVLDSKGEELMRLAMLGDYGKWL